MSNGQNKIFQFKVPLACLAFFLNSKRLHRIIDGIRDLVLGTPIMLQPLTSSLSSGSRSSVIQQEQQIYPHFSGHRIGFTLLCLVTTPALHGKGNAASKSFLFERSHKGLLDTIYPDLIHTSALPSTRVQHKKQRFP